VNALSVFYETRNRQVSNGHLHAERGAKLFPVDGLSEIQILETLRWRFLLAFLKITLRMIKRQEQNNNLR